MTDNNSPVSSVGSMKWKNESIRNVNEARKLTKKVSKSCERTVNENTKPGTRLNVISYTNEQANQKFRTLRQMSNSAREYLIDVNQQMRSGNRLIETLNKKIYLIDKDESKNQMSIKIRENRPAVEKVTDNADLFLKNEQNILKELKQSLIKKKQQIQNINIKLSNSKELLTRFTKNLSPLLLLTPDNTLPPKIKADDTSTENMDENVHIQKDFEKIIDEAQGYMMESKNIKKDVETYMKLCDGELNETKNQVNEALRTKVVETKSLQKELKVAVSEIQQATNKSVKTFERTEHSWLDMKGPESKYNASINERPDRPLLKAFQQPPTNHPEIFDQKIHSEKLLHSMKGTFSNMELLKSTQQNLQKDICDKKHGALIDQKVKILRNQKI